jgi:hypothetical protein
VAGVGSEGSIDKRRHIPLLGFRCHFTPRQPKKTEREKSKPLTKKTHFHKGKKEESKSKKL